MLFDITIPEIPIIITLEPQNSAYVYLGHRSENRALSPSILSKIRIYDGFIRDKSSQKTKSTQKFALLRVFFVCIYVDFGAVLACSLLIWP